MRLPSKKQSNPKPRTKNKDNMSGRARTQRSARSLPVQKNMSSDEDSDDPLSIDGNIIVKNEVCPDILLANDDEEIFGLVDSQNLVAEHQRMCYNTDIAASGLDQRNIFERLGSLERKVDFLLNINSKILARVDKICEDLKGGGKQINEFPIGTVEGLAEIDQKIANGRNKYIELFKHIIRPDGLDKNINRLFETSLIMKMNYSGTGDKIGLNNYHNLNMAIYESQRVEEGFTISDHMKNVREAFQKAKNRAYKAESKKRKTSTSYKNDQLNKSDHLFKRKKMK